MASLANGQCAHQTPGFSRCLDLAVEVRLVVVRGVEYLIPLCGYHANTFDAIKVVRGG